MIALTLSSLTAAAAPKTATYDIYESRCSVAVSTFLHQGCLGATLQSWSSGKFSLNASAPSGLPSGGEWAIAAEPDPSTTLWLHGSLVWLAGDQHDLMMSAYNSGAAGARVKMTVCGGDAATKAGDAVLSDPLPSRTWVKLSVPFKRFGVSDAKQQINGLKLQIVAPGAVESEVEAPAAPPPRKRALLSGGSSGELALGGTPPPPFRASETTVYLTELQASGAVRTVDAASATPAATPTAALVSPLLFGANFAPSGTAFTANRWGGNAVTRYAWDLDVQNHASDWFFENIPNGNDDDGAAGGKKQSKADAFVAATLAAGATPVLTVPTIGWAPRDAQRRCGFAVAKYGEQNETDPYHGACGNGQTPGGASIVGNDPADTSRAVGPDYAVAWLAHLAATHGAAALNASVFILDNEPNFWHGTHRDVHPAPLTYAELWNYTHAWATALKSAHPAATLAGPDISSYQGLTAPADGGRHALVEGGGGGGGSSLTMVEALLRDLGAHEAATGARLLDILDVHCYPEAKWNASRMAAAADATLRLRLTRELWDPAHYAESWEAVPMYYLRWLASLVQQHAPWLRLSCTEYSYQASMADDDDVVGAAITLDALAIYAREGVSLATKWQGPKPGTVAAYALYEFLNDYDGEGGSIAGAKYVQVETDSELLGAHAFASAAAYQLLLLSKQPADTMVVTVTLPAGCSSAGLYRLDADHTKRGPHEPLKLSAAHQAVVPLPAMGAALVVCSLD